ncbi:hypothetical protein BS47DRAFT_1358284 [Hydnum rufescens UP504]|uniref:Uncharacterized protein n=1 Tax=Hydnum rufescens UP504 TaxID=1448309 RepID=A0A9P6B7D8_9AGAM|nr:hypothetical protein BS47DRAFT_1358284 [Hydnum rufescens UP504]
MYHTPAAAVFNYKTYESTKRAAEAALLALSQRKNPCTTQPDPRTRDHGAKNEYHTPALAGVCLSSGPNTRDPLNEHRRTTTHPPNESREWQRVETTMQAPDEPHTRRSGCGILLNPHPPTEATTPPSENTRPWVRGNPNGEVRNDVPGTTHLPKRYHTPARAGVWCY